MSLPPIVAIGQNNNGDCVRGSHKMTKPSGEMKTLTLAIGGMHCASCELTIERRFKQMPGVVGVIANRNRGAGGDPLSQRS